MRKAQVDCMQGDAVNATLVGFFRRIFSVTDHRVTDRGELHANLVLQACNQRRSNQCRGSGSRSTAKCNSAREP